MEKRREKDWGEQSTKTQQTQAHFGEWKHLHFLSSLKGNKKLPSGIKFEEKLPKGGMDVNHASIPHYGLHLKYFLLSSFFLIHSVSKEVNWAHKTQPPLARVGMKYEG